MWRAVAAAMLVAVAWLALVPEAVAQPKRAPPPPVEPINPVDELKAKGDEAMGSLRYEEALDHYTRAFELEARPALLYNRGRALEALARFAEALDLITEFERQAPDDLKAQVPQLAELLVELRGKVSELTVTVSVAGASVVVGGRVLGKAPLAGPVRLNAGPAVVEVTADGFHPFKKSVVLPGGKSLAVDARLKTKSKTGILRVDSPVVGAIVFVDGAQLGKVPAEKELLAGKHAVIVRADGYEEARTSAVVTAGERRTVTVKLDETPAVTSRWWFWTGAGVVVAGGVALTVALLTERPADSGDIEPGQVAAPLYRF